MTALDDRPAPATSKRRLRADPLTLAACAGAALPVIVSTVRGITAGWAPTGDRAIIALRAYDVLTSHTPLVGQYSATSQLLDGQPVHSPGPLLYWLLALPARVGPWALMAATIGLVGSVAAVAIVLLARRHGGSALMVATAIALAVTCRSIVGETWHDIWNPSAALLPFALLILCCWSLACGELRTLPLVALLASFVIQAELTYALPAAAMVAVGLVGLRATRRAGPAPAGSVRRWGGAALAVAAACWLAPVIDELTRSDGNLSLLLRAATRPKPTVGVGTGWHALVQAVGVPPWWTRVPRDPFDHLADVRAAPTALAVTSTVAIVLAAAALLALAIRRRRRDVAAALAIAFVLGGSLVAVTAATPTRPSLLSTLGYTLWWGSFAGMWIWLAVGWAVFALFGGDLMARLARSRREPSSIAIGASGERAAFGGFRLRRAPRRLAATLAAGLAALAVGAAVAAVEQDDQDGVEYRPARAIVARVKPELTASRSVRIEGSGGYTLFDYASVMAYALRREGKRVFSEGFWRRLDRSYDPRGRHWDVVVDVRAEGSAGGRVVARVPVHAAIERGRPPRLVSVDRVVVVRIGDGR